MARPLIAANWKANPDSPGRAVLLAQKIEKALVRAKNAEVVIAPPHPFLAQVGAVLKKARLGAQNMFWEDTGPYTGEISWRQLKHLKVEYVIIGHSERKFYLGETDEMINKKVRAALENGLKPILCVGESERHGNDIPSVVGEQLKNALAGVKKNFLKNLTVVYEPVWAISTTPRARPDTPDNAFRAKLYIKKVIAGIFGKNSAERVRIIYGGSVNPQNIGGFIKDGQMDGALVGGASLKPDEFAKIVEFSR